MSSTIVADSLAAHSGKSDRREWHTVGAWLHPGEQIVIVGADDAALAEPETELVAQCHPFVVRHYISDDRPILKGNGFDGLEIGADREEAERFVAWVNARITTPPARQPLTTDQIVKLWNESIANGAVLGLSDTVLFARAIECKITGGNNE